MREQVLPPQRFSNACIACENGVVRGLNIDDLADFIVTALDGINFPLRS